MLMQKPRGLFGGSPMDTPMTGGPFVNPPMGAAVMQPQGPMPQQQGPMPQPQGMFGALTAAKPEPHHGINWGHVLVDALSGAAGQEGPYAAAAMHRQQQQEAAQIAASQRAASMEDHRANFDYEQAHKAPDGPTADQRNYEWYSTLTPEQKKTYDILHPVIVIGKDGPYAVPRSSLTAPQGGADDEWGPVVDHKPGGANGYSAGGGFPKVTPRGLDAITVNSESGGNPNAVSPKGARGLWQVMPSTARDPGFGIRPSNGTQSDDARVGQEYRKTMERRYSGNLPSMWGAYNWGPGAVDAARAKYGENWLQHAPAETQAYVNKNMKMVRGR